MRIKVTGEVIEVGGLKHAEGAGFVELQTVERPLVIPLPLEDVRAMGGRLYSTVEMVLDVELKLVGLAKGSDENPD